MAHQALSTFYSLICISFVETHAASPRICHVLIRLVDVAGMDSRPDGALPEVTVADVHKSESAAPAVDLATTPLSTPAVAHAAQGPAPTPITRVDPPVSMPGEPFTPPSAASSPASAFGFGPGAGMHAGPPGSGEAPEAQDAGMLTQFCVWLSCS